MSLADPERLARIVVEALAAVIDGGREAERVLDRTLRRHRDLAPAERAAVARRVLGVACLRGRLDFELDQRCPGWRRPAPPASPHSFRVAAYAAAQEGADVAAAASAGGLPREALVGLESPVQWPADPIERLAAFRSLPRWLAERLVGSFGAAAADELAAALGRPGPVVLRANLLRATRDEVRRALAEEGIATEPTALSPWGLVVSGRANLFGSRAWRGGLFEVQDEGSQLVARLVGARPGERVVDFCAGAGGKTLALAAAMENRGDLLALDPDAHRLLNLAARVRRAGASVVRWRRLEPDQAAPPAGEPAGVGAGGGGGWADRVLVDAPCSSLGTLRRSPDLRWRLGPEAIARFAKLQGEILDRAAACVRPSGLLVYATCTLTAEENQEVVAAFLGRRPGYRAEGEPLVLLPHVHGTDGFFAQALRHSG